MAVIGAYKKNRLGTMCFEAKFHGMRKSQEFTVYPIKERGCETATIQSDTRIGQIRLSDGAVFLSKSRAGGAYFHHLAEAVRVDGFSAEDLLIFKAYVCATADSAAGDTGVVYVDNSGAAGVFGLQGEGVR